MKRNKDDGATVVVKTGSTLAGISTGVLAVIVAAIMAIGGWFWFNGKNDSPKSVIDDVSGIVKDDPASAPTMPPSPDGTTPGTMPDSTTPAPDTTLPDSTAPTPDTPASGAAF